MVKAVTTFLMFKGTAEQAMEHYVALFEGAGITELDRYGPGEGGSEGSIRRAVLTLCGQAFICIDSPVEQDFDFTPSMSLFVDCEDRDELLKVFEGLADGGEVLMPVDNYGFSEQFAWVNDRFGVSWQLNVQ